ncbi:hypothetical protein UFOVP1244_125 [uncultured Caudovirales phage]|uniref:Uncharacterized protein n=1 Tax=uncultured Caudovirales phage TaxID=2100421 RepID=A0A6J5RH53_9CAUD|nr:hypothetical protein UFOVP1244_125 [uncultured Caudovirales phage]
MVSKFTTQERVTLNKKINEMEYFNEAKKWADRAIMWSAVSIILAVVSLVAAIVGFIR